jgi:hypothetical protein
MTAVTSPVPLARYRASVHLVLLNLLIACDPSSGDAADTAAPSHFTLLPGHNTCLPDGEAMDDQTCLDLLEADGRQPTTAEEKTGLDPIPDDPRVDDPELAWLTGQIERCACTCCHHSSLGGCGVHKYDLDYQPVWIDSMSTWSARLLGGIVDSEERYLPVEDLDRVAAVLQVEIDRREAAEDD